MVTKLLGSKTQAATSFRSLSISDHRLKGRLGFDTVCAEAVVGAALTKVHLVRAAVLGLSQVPQQVSICTLGKLQRS